MAKRSTFMFMALVSMASMSALAGCGFLPGGYYYEQWHAHDPGIHDWDWHVGDIDGEVGHRFYHYVLTMDCEPSRHWTMDAEVVSGSLPPGLSFVRAGTIDGIPEERGHWIVRLRLYNITCNDRVYPAFESEQELRFHISGTGRVLQ